MTKTEYKLINSERSEINLDYPAKRTLAWKKRKCSSILRSNLKKILTSEKRNLKYNGLEKKIQIFIAQIYSSSLIIQCLQSIITVLKSMCVFIVMFFMWYSLHGIEFKDCILIQIFHLKLGINAAATTDRK